MARVLNLHLPIGNLQIHGVFCLAFDKEKVVTRCPESYGKISAAVGVAPVTGQRGFAHRGITAGGNGSSKSEGASAQCENIVRPERIRSGLHTLIDDPGSNAIAADKSFAQVLGQFFNPGCAIT